MGSWKGAVSFVRNDRQLLFAAIADDLRYRQELRATAHKHGCVLHAYVLMTHHVHLHYIELNPTRARMVAELGDYRWSIHRCNALGEHDAAITPHPRYLSLGADASTRQATYRELLKTSLEPADTDALRDHTRQNKAFGNDRFRRRIEALIGRSMEIRSRGRPKPSVGK